MKKRVRVQVYEVQKPREAEKLIDIGVDHIGSVVLSKKAWKDREIKETIELTGRTSAKSSLIPLFSETETLFKTLDYYQPDIIHFCESIPLAKSEGPGHHLSTDLMDGCGRLIEQQGKIKEKFPEVKIMRSIPIPIEGSASVQTTISLAKLFEPVSDLFLTDTLLLNDSAGSDSHITDKLQPVEGFVGITGRTCDWDVAADLVRSSQIPVILAGGISPDNVFDGIVKTKPAGIDSCTGTNAVDVNGQSVRFKKDINRVKHLVEAVRKAESQI